MREKKMKCKKIMIILIMAICLFAMASVSASDVNDTVIASTGDSAVELSQADADEIMSTDENELIGQTDNELISEGNCGTFAELQANITQATEGSTITLNKNYECEDGFDSGGILIDRPITIDGQGNKIDAQGKSRIFRITAENVVLKNIIFTNGKSTGTGGAVHFSSEGTVTNCNFTGNKAINDGGAIWMSSGSVENCNFADNQASRYGGAVYFDETGTVSNCNFSYNTATQRGGAIWMSSGSVENCNFTDNKATGSNSRGGAVHFLNTGTVSNCNFADNSASHGGAIFSNNWYTAADTCIFKRNSGDNVNTVIYPPTLNVDNFTTFYGFGEKLTFNLTTDSGMPVNNGNISISVYFKNGTWVGNYSCLSGEGWIPDLPVGSYYANFTTEYAGFQQINRAITIYPPEHTFWALNYTINGNDNHVIELSNDFYFDPAYDAAFVDGIVINRPVTINGNGSSIDAKGQARIFNVQSANTVIENLTLKNANGINGGAVYFNSTGTVTNCNFTNNQATSNKGGAVCFAEDTTGTVTNCNFINNKVTGIYTSAGDYNHGGAIYMYSGTVTNCNFTGNNATGDYSSGGAVYIGGDGNVTNCNFINNEVNGYQSSGGAVYFYNEGTVTNCNFTDNSASFGGAVWMQSDSIKNCNFVNNTATTYGGAVYFNMGGNVTNCNFINNKAIYGYGGAIYFEFDSTGTVENCNFINNKAMDAGGAIEFGGIGTVTNCNFADNQAGYSGGAVRFEDIGSVTNCNFTNNQVTEGSICCGGAVYFGFQSNGTVENCNFINNKAPLGGAVYFYETGNVSNCNFTDNQAIMGGAVYSTSTGGVTNCNFTDNRADFQGGAVFFNGNGNVANCNFTDNNANIGSAIYVLMDSANTLTISNSILLNNRANANALEVTKNENNITITFTGQNNLLNAIHSSYDGEVTFNNVTYWGAYGITKTGSSIVNPSRSDKEAGQNITVGVVVNDELVLDKVYVTDENGTIVLNINAGENYFIGVRHNEDSYYTEAEKIISQNIKFYANVTSISTTNKTVNITAKSNIPNVEGKLLFILPNGANITANYAGNGTWWAEHTFDDYAVYQVNATYVGLDNVTINNATISISKTPTNITVENATVYLFIYDSMATGATLTPADAGNLTFTSSNSSVVKVENGNIIAVSEGTALITVSFAGSEDYAAAENKTITVNVIKYDSKVTISPINDTVYPNNVTIKYSVENKTNVTVTVDGVSGDKIIITNDSITVIGLDAGNYTITILNNESDLYYNSSDTKSFTVNKLATSISAADVSTTYNINRDLVITLKDANGNALSGVNVAVDLNGAKTYVTDANGQIMVSTEGLAPKTYAAKVTFNGNTNYAESSKDVKVTVKKATPKLTAKKKTFKTSVKTKKYTITLKDNTGKAIKKAKVTLKVKGKTYKATTNSKGKATFKIKKLNKKGTFKVKITYKGDKYYNKATKKAKIKVIVTFKTVSKGSKDKSTVKEIQQALKDHGYYLSYKGHYLKIDGKFKGCTERSVKEFQHDKGLKVTGKVDEKTAKKLGLI